MHTLGILILLLLLIVFIIREYMYNDVMHTTSVLEYFLD